MTYTKKRIISNLNEGITFFQDTILSFLSNIEENSIKEEYILKINIKDKEYIQQYMLDICASLEDGISKGLQPLDYHNIYCEHCLDQEFKDMVNKISNTEDSNNEEFKKITKMYNELSNDKELSIEIKDTIIEIPQTNKHFVGCLKDALLEELNNYLPV